MRESVRARARAFQDRPMRIASPFIDARSDRLPRGTGAAGGA